MTPAELDARVTIIKETLPDISLRTHYGDILRGRIAGKHNEFATLFALVGGSWLGAGEACWETVARCIAEDEPINV